MDILVRILLDIDISMFFDFLAKCLRTKWQIATQNHSNVHNHEVSARCTKDIRGIQTGFHKM
ncbi:hypothetical protein PsorP6_007489 [Peronosclerospora sorghi]|uniref:Uncharacterized protein n=1 Tax=Peronosclerospora sorghi TaxID=230839 RepID=A0ACC0WCS6_9STRA|nr:hypothetical protein PsorP6_007489 [Peronosclerospora sorghi]